jgi:hypothetical protein
MKTVRQEICGPFWGVRSALFSSLLGGFLGRLFQVDVVSSLTQVFHVDCALVPQTSLADQNVPVIRHKRAIATLCDAKSVNRKV